MSDVAEGRCPLCGQDNGCALAGGGDPASCWCANTELPQGQLLGLGDARNCLCPTCAAKAVSGIEVSEADG